MRQTIFMAFVCVFTNGLSLQAREATYVSQLTKKDSYGIEMRSNYILSINTCSQQNMESTIHSDDIQDYFETNYFLEPGYA